MQIGNIMVSVGGMAVIGGLTIMIADKPNATIGGILTILGLILCIGAYAKVKSDDEKELKRQRDEFNRLDDISKGINGMSNNIGSLINEIREDRKTHSNK